MRLSDFTALTFDCYGTLIDWETGIWDAFQPLLLANGRGDILRADLLGTFASFESRYQADEPGLFYPALLEKCHRETAERYRMATSDALNGAFGASLAHWPAFPDTADALRALKRHYKLIILSNVNRTGFELSNRKLGVEFDDIITAQDVGSYKPNPRNFEVLLDVMQKKHGVAQNAILHTAQSLFHDHVPATQAGLAKCWIDRQNLAETENWGATAAVHERPTVDFRFLTMGAMAKARETEG